ncbi:MAG: glycosyltransferase family 4 protein [Candidatus Adiutrix sp.]|jgi:glycosyltransferase involved in cell wall biosynthesis|nr:glycosyltransferase family 4 protein [Candidatus Adiutrix sp.]
MNAPPAAGRYPARKIGFYAGGPPFAGDSLERGEALGGSETAFIQMTRALARRGHRVWAFNSCPRPGNHGGVLYHNFNATLGVLARESFDIFVASRCPAFFNLPISAGLKVLWNHDTLDNPRELKLIHDEIDLFLVLSNFHRNNFLTRLPHLDDRLVVTRNGLDFELLDQSSAEETDPHKLIYASRPERGLKLLLEDIWPRLHHWNPDLQLQVCGYQLKLEGLPPRLEEVYRRVDYLLAHTPGVVNLGSLGKRDYYRHLSRSALMLYPSIFPEISCLAVLEAQGLGVPVLTSDAFALAESVADPQLRVGGRPGSPEYTHAYVDRALALLGHRRELARLGREARTAVRARYGWDLVAAEWERLFDLNLRAKSGQGYWLEMKVDHAARTH